MSITLDVMDVAKIYCSILIKCPKCGKIMTPLGDLGMDPYHHCFDCGISIPFDEVPNSSQEATEG